jgi:regulator of nonsense transcripts 1
MGTGLGEHQDPPPPPTPPSQHFTHHSEQDEELLICSEFAQNLKFIDEEIDRHSPSEFPIPSHACSYCNISNPSSVVKCLTCSRWFCNAKGNSTASHAVTHLVRSKHKEICLHPDSPLGDTTLECYNCGCRNVFLLGFIPAKGDSTVILLCRQPCVAAGASSKDDSWDIEQWQPLIEDKAFLPWLVAKPSEKEQKSAKSISVTQMNRIEETWREQPQANIKDIEATPEVEPENVCISYNNEIEYANIFHPLVSLEAENEKKMKEAARQENVTVRWDISAGGQKIAWFILSRYDSEVRIALGDEVILSYNGASTFGGPNKKWNAFGFISKVSPTAGDEIAIELESVSQPPTEITNGFTVDFIWKPTPYTRMHNALKSFSRDKNSISNALKRKLLAKPEEINDESCVVSASKSQSRMLNASQVSVSSLASELNHSQVNAILQAINRPLSLIQGPPGTGKTVTSATLIYHLVRLGLGPVLVCAPSNVAVDQLAEKIHHTGVKVLRLVAKAKEAMESPVGFLTLHEQVKSVDIYPDFQRLSQLKKEKGSLSASDEDKLKLLRAQTEKILLKAADVVCCTCVGAGDLRLHGYKFRTVIVDEATQAREPECLIPLTHGAERAVLIGDHQQLGPVIMCKKAAKAGFNQSLFERLVVAGLKPFRLQVQYRMHPCLSEFPSNAFYEGSLQNGVTAADRTPSSHDFTWPKRGTPMFFHVNLGHEEISSSGTSYLNRNEAMTCEKMVTRFLKNGVSPSSIGIITPYEGQRAFLINYMQMNGALPKEKYAEIEVASVDAFQGREKDYIILSCVRSNDHLGIGFLSDFRRLNVALTRAKYGLIILGNARVLSRHQLWFSLLSNYKSRGLLVEGPISNLRYSLVTLIHPRSNGEKRVKHQPQQPEKPLSMNFDFNPLSGLISADTIGKDQFEVFDSYSQVSINDEVVYKPGGGAARRFMASDFFHFDSLDEQIGKGVSGNYSQSSQYSQSSISQEESANFYFNCHS